MARCCPCLARNNKRPPEVLAAADHLEVPRQHGLFNHHGIDLGDGTVAHYLEGREILHSPLEEFCQGQPLRVINYVEASPQGVSLRRGLGGLGDITPQVKRPFIVYIILAPEAVYRIHPVKGFT